MTMMTIVPMRDVVMRDAESDSSRTRRKRKRSPEVEMERTKWKKNLRLLTKRLAKLESLEEVTQHMEKVTLAIYEKVTQHMEGLEKLETNLFEFAERMDQMDQKNWTLSDAIYLKLENFEAAEKARNEATEERFSSFESEMASMRQALDHGNFLMTRRIKHLRKDVLRMERMSQFTPETGASGIEDQQGDAAGGFSDGAMKPKRELQQSLSTCDEGDIDNDQLNENFDFHEGFSLEPESTAEEVLPLPDRLIGTPEDDVQNLKIAIMELHGVQTNRKGGCSDFRRKLGCVEHYIGAIVDEELRSLLYNKLWEASRQKMSTPGTWRSFLPEMMAHLKPKPHEYELVSKIRRRKRRRAGPRSFVGETLIKRERSPVSVQRPVLENRAGSTVSAGETKAKVERSSVSAKRPVTIKREHNLPAQRPVSIERQHNIPA